MFSGVSAQTKVPCSAAVGAAAAALAMSQSPSIIPPDIPTKPKKTAAYAHATYKFVVGLSAHSGLRIAHSADANALRRRLPRLSAALCSG